VTKIVLEVDENNLGSVITLLNSLKEGLITKMEVSSCLREESSKTDTKKFTRYQPKTDRVIYEEEQSELKSMGKYLDLAEFKKRLRKN